MLLTITALGKYSPASLLTLCFTLLFRKMYKLLPAQGPRKGQSDGTNKQLTDQTCDPAVNEQPEHGVFATGGARLTDLVLLLRNLSRVS